MWDQEKVHEQDICINGTISKRQSLVSALNMPVLWHSWALPAYGRVEKGYWRDVSLYLTKHEQHIVLEPLLSVLSRLSRRVPQ